MIHQASIGCSRTFCGVSCDGWPYAFSADAAKVLKYLFLSIIAWQSWFRRNIHLHFAFCASLTKAMVHCRSICTCDTQLWHFVFVTLLPTGRSRVIKKFSSRSQSKTSWAPMKQTISQHQWYRGSSHDFWWLGFDSSHVEKMVIRLASSHVFHRMTRLESQSMTRVRVIFTKSLSSWWANPVRLHTKKWGFFASVMIKIGGNFLFWLSSCAMLQSSVPNLRRGRPETLLSLRSQ